MTIVSDEMIAACPGGTIGLEMIVPSGPVLFTRERSAVEVVEGEPPRLCAIDDIADRPHQAGEALSVGIADDGHDETFVAERDRVAEIDLACAR